jgi:hypothetical protein
MRLDASALRALNLMDSRNVSLTSLGLFRDSYRSLEEFRSEEHDASWTLEQM